MDLSIIISAVIALAAGLMVGWLATKARADQIRADLIEERRELDIELSAARQQLAQEAHWREECELLNNELRSLRDINTSLEPISVRSPPGSNPPSCMRKIRSAR